MMTLPTPKFERSMSLIKYVREKGKKYKSNFKYW